MLLTNKQVARYKIMSRDVCERYCTQQHKETSIIISIRSSWDPVKPNVFCDDKNNVKGVLYLAFDDCDMEDDKVFGRTGFHGGAMTKLDGDLVAEFVNEFYDKVDRIIVHCDGGKSRSAGVAAAIMRVKEKSDSDIWRMSSKCPNVTCFLMTLKGFGYI